MKKSFYSHQPVVHQMLPVCTRRWNPEKQIWERPDCVRQTCTGNCFTVGYEITPEMNPPRKFSLRNRIKYFLLNLKNEFYGLVRN